MWSAAHGIVELAMVVGIGATAAGFAKIWWIEGRIVLVIGVTLLLCCTLLGTFS